VSSFRRSGASSRRRVAAPSASNGAGPDGPIPTLGWEGRREGIDDYRYFHTLETLAEQACTRGNAQARAVAKEAGPFLDDLRARVRPDAYDHRPPFNNAAAVDFLPQPEITPADYDRFREEAARLIAQLQEVLSP
jgi:hypothetical protein